MLSKNANNKKFVSKLTLFNEKKNWQKSDHFWQWKLTLKVKFWHFLTPPEFTNGYIDFLAKIFSILYPWLENSTTCTTIAHHICPSHLDFKTFRRLRLFLCDDVTIIGLFRWDPKSASHWIQSGCYLFLPKQE